MKKNGFTLIEIILSLAIMGIIAAGFLSVFSANMNFIVIDRERTSNQFLGQEQMEAEISLVKSKIKDPTEGAALTYVTLEDVFEPGIDIKVLSVSHTVGNQTLVTLLSDNQPLSLPVPSIESVTATLRSNAIPVDFAYAKPSTNIVGAFVLSPVNADLFLVNTYRWYVSRAGFNIPVPHGAITEMEWGNKYPIFPDDYALIETTTDINLNNVTAYGGRHIVLEVTPASKSGKIGEPVPSHPIYISGLPIISKEPLLHLDASSIDLEDTNQYVLVGDDYFLKKWVDISSYSKDAVPSNAASRPLIIENEINGEFAGRYINYNDSTDSIVNHNALLGETLTVFTLTRGDDSSPYFENGSVQLFSTGEMINNEWRLNQAVYVSDSNDIIIGNHDIDISEIVVFKGTLTADEISSVSDYFKAKYKQLENIGQIVALQSESATVYKDDLFSLPSVLKATMTVGNAIYTPVTWNGTVDTSTLGTTIFTATSSVDPSKTATFTLTVINRVAVTGLALEPTTLLMISGQISPLTVDVSPENAYNQNVLWSSANSLVATVSQSGVVTAIGPGTTTITAETEDGHYTATCSVEVWADRLPNGIVLHLDSTVINPTGGGRVSEWLDQSGYSNNFYQGSNNIRPNLGLYAQLGLPIVEFPSTRNAYLTLYDNNLEGVDFYMDSTRNFTVFIVGSANTGNPNSTFISKSGGWGTSATYAFGLNSLSQFQQVIRGNNSTTVGNGNVSPGNNDLNLHMSMWDGSNHYYYINGTEKIGHNNIGTRSNQTNDIYIGAAGNSNYLRGQIAEIIVFNRALSDSERIQVENFLQDKWLKIPSVFWRFNAGTESWIDGNDIVNFGYLNEGKISGNIVGVDPFIMSPVPLNVDISVTKRIKIKLKNNTNSSMAQLYFTTASDQTMNETKHKNFAIVPNSDYLEYTVDLSDLPSWNGTLRQLRIDPSVGVSSGSFEIDEILIIE